MKIGFDQTRRDEKYVYEYNYKGSRKNNQDKFITVVGNRTSNKKTGNENISLDPALNNGLGITSLKDFIE